MKKVLIFDKHGTKSNYSLGEIFAVECPDVEKFHLFCEFAVPMNKTHSIWGTFVFSTQNSFTLPFAATLKIFPPSVKIRISSHHLQPKKQICVSPCGCIYNTFSVVIKLPTIVYNHNVF